MLNGSKERIALIVEGIKPGSMLYHAEVEIVYVIEGSLALNADGEIHALRKGDVIIVNPGKIHNVTVTSEGFVCRLLMDGGLFTNGTSADMPRFWCDTSARSTPHDAGLKNLFMLIIRRYIDNDSPQDLVKVSLYYQLASYIQEHYCVSSEGNATLNASTDYDKERVDRALMYIHANYSQQLTLTDLAEYLHLTNTYLSKYFKKSLGVNFKDYLTRIRLNHALDDLLHTDKSVLRAAVDNGFPNVTMFSQSFKAVYGSTPSEYKQVMKSRPESDPVKTPELQNSIMAGVERAMGGISEIHVDSITIEASESVAGGEAIKKPWATMINVGTLSDLLNSEIQKHLLILRQQLEIKYVRFWGVFQESIVILNNKEFRLNASRIDHAINFLLENGMKPFILLGPKTRNIINKIGSISYPTSLVNASDYNDTRWAAYLEAFMVYCMERFGLAEVESWIFEMWCPNPWDAVWANWYSDEKYESFYRTVKRHVPNALVGGCEWERRAHSERIKSSAAYWLKKGVKPDFVSFQLFPYILPDIQDVSTLRTIVDADYFLQEVRQMRTTLDSLSLGNTKLFISLWNMTISNRNILNDTCFKGAWIMKNMLDIATVADIAGYWVASDVYGEEYDSTSILFGGVGIITKNGIFKPAYHAFRFLREVMDTFVAKGDNYMISKDNSGNYLVLFHNMKTLNLQSLRRFNDTDLCGLKQLFENHNSIKLKLTLADVESRKYYVRISSVSKYHGSVLDDSTKWSPSVVPKQIDSDYLRKTCIPHVVIQVIDSANRQLHLDIDIRQNEFGMIQITPQY
jgi:beta-xylosidase/AraC-like DNA-binding protein